MQARVPGTPPRPSYAGLCTEVRPLGAYKGMLQLHALRVCSSLWCDVCAGASEMTPPGPQAPPGPSVPASQAGQPPLQLSVQVAQAVAQAQGTRLRQPACALHPWPSARPPSKTRPLSQPQQHRSPSPLQFCFATSFCLPSDVCAQVLFTRMRRHHTAGLACTSSLAPAQASLCLGCSRCVAWLLLSLQQAAKGAKHSARRSSPLGARQHLTLCVTFPLLVHHTLVVCLCSRAEWQCNTHYGSGSLGISAAFARGCRAGGRQWSSRVALLRVLSSSASSARAAPNVLRFRA